ncbi:acyl-CoA dehydrogenase family protein [Streptomyces sp. KL116D]|uniref:acyl-CoA dehydrogenase family protein n=1 Tax=Streptomyces sp. KL116D TaxID=3045152 RepID=UPI003555C53A
MHFAFTDEQEDLRRTVRAFFDDTSSEPELRRLMDSAEGYNPGVWHRMGSEIGIQGLIVPEEFGGAGCGMIELGTVMEEAGRALLCAPLLSSAVMATTALLQCDAPDARKRLLPRLAAGEIVATFALTEDSGRWDAGGVQLAAREDKDGDWQLSGHKNFVLDGTVADVILTVARTPEGIGLFSVEGDAPGLLRDDLPTLDPTRRQARLEYQNVPAVRLRTPGNCWEHVSAVLDRSAAALAVEQVGVAERALDMAVEYAKTRHQFGRAIGSFQAVKHLLADVLLEVESARAAAYFALLSADGGGDDLPTVAGLAKAFCSDAAVQAASQNIQVHGGIGFTWEHSAHLYLKRAKTSQMLLGDSQHHREVLAQRIGV